MPKLEQLDLFSQLLECPKSPNPIPKIGDRVKGRSIGGMGVTGTFQGYSNSGCWLVRNDQGGMRLVDPDSGEVL